jgi:hypothetical protein
VSDGHWISKQGRPVVVVVQKVFENAARAQARVMGAPNLPICAYPATPVGGDITPVASALAEQVVAILQRPDDSGKEKPQ